MLSLLKVYTDNKYYYMTRDIKLRSIFLQIWWTPRCDAFTDTQTMLVFSAKCYRKLRKYFIIVKQKGSLRHIQTRQRPNFQQKEVSWLLRQIILQATRKIPRSGDGLRMFDRIKPQTSLEVILQGIDQFLYYSGSHPRKGYYRATRAFILRLVSLNIRIFQSIMLENDP